MNLHSPPKSSTKYMYSIQIVGFILIRLYFTTSHFHTCVLCKERSLFPFDFLAQFSATYLSSFVGIVLTELGLYTMSKQVSAFQFSWSAVSLPSLSSTIQHRLR